METEDNVVRLPRDWLGPREELIPFGPSAEGDDEALATPPSTHDFWGEPAMGQWEPDSDGAEPRPRRPLLGVRRSEILSRSRAGVREHRRAAGIASLVAIGVLALVFALSGSGGHRHQLSGAASRPAPTTQTALAGLTPGRALSSLASRGRHRAGHRSSRGARPRVKTPFKRHSVHRGSHVTRAATVQSVRYTRPAASSSATPPATSAAPTAPAPTSGSARTSAAPPSGSTSQPAVGAAGALAPGTSPDS